MQQYRIDPEKPFKLDANDLGDWDGKKKAAQKAFNDLQKEFAELQQILYAEQKRKVLIILQAMDTGGKDGTIRSLLEKVNPQGVKIANFKVPSIVELAHDYLWRVHAMVPGKGEMVIFNRSHYEDVLVVRVHELVPKEVWKKRFDQINAFEKILAEEDTTILKFYLHIDKEEQKQRFLERLNDPKKQWKFNPNDLEERKLWDDYQEAYQDVLNKTSTAWAPWYAIPANRNWYRNLCVSTIIIDTLHSLKLKYPDPLPNPEMYVQALESEGLGK
ncbi:MAG: polyphosphate kinase 2 family protein [Anaerolineaceae bacterium]